MRYLEFFSIEIEHSYFSRGSVDLVLSAASETEELFKKRGLLLKKTAKGVQCYAGINPEDKGFPEKIKDDVFVFYVFPTSNIVREFTDMSAVENDKMVLFTNEKLPKNQLELKTSSIDQEGNCNGFPALAKVEIKGSELDASEDNKGRSYRIRFATTAVKWKYYFLAQQDANEITIEASDQEIAFTEVNTKDDFSDQVAASLQLNFPESKVLIFESDTAIPFSNTPIKDINLKRDGEVLIEHLPNPDSKHGGIQIMKIK